MANYIFGDVDEIVCQHTLGEFRFAPKSNESATVDFGGVRVNDDANQVTANGQNMKQQNRAKWSVEVPVAVDMVSENNTLEDIAKLAAHPDDGTWTFSFLNGAVFRGKGCPVGDIQGDSNAGTVTLKTAGGGKLEKL
ncbi:hypothetical protein D3C85_581840 [compost metagenome]